MHLAPLLLSLAVGAVVLELVRRRRLREEFSWMWLMGAGGAVLLSLWPGARELVARLLNTDVDGAVLALAVLFLACVALDISTKVSRLANHQKNLAQGLARLEKRLGDLEGVGSDEDG